jgi:hypothetical protein
MAATAKRDHLTTSQAKGIAGYVLDSNIVSSHAQGTVVQNDYLNVTHQFSLLSDDVLLLPDCNRNRNRNRI